MNETGYNEEILQECVAVGAAVLAAQRVEFLLYGLVAHVKVEMKWHDKRFRDLTPESFLRGELSDLRATLGQLAKAYGTEFLLSADDLDLFVKNRNLIVHDYWRLTKSAIRGARTLESPMAFLMDFLRDCQRWEGILRGVLAHMKLAAIGATGCEQQPKLTLEDLNYMDDYLQHVRSHLDPDPE